MNLWIFYSLVFIRGGLTTNGGGIKTNENLGIGAIVVLFYS